MLNSPEERKMIEALTRSGKMSESEARAFLENQRCQLSKSTRRDARFGLVASILALFACGALFFYQYQIGRYYLGFSFLLICIIAFCLGAVVRNFRNLNAR
jgi:hypothetical protein